MTKPMDVVGLGTILVDHLVVLPVHPEADTKNAVLADHLQVGGPVPTALAMLRRLGRRCSFIGSWSDDPFGRFVEEDFRRERIDSRASVRRIGGRTGFAHAWVCRETARRTIAYHRLAQSVTSEELDRELLGSARALHLDGWPPETALSAARIAKSNGVLVVLDVGSLKPGMQDLIPYVDVLNAPRRFLTQFLDTDDLRRGMDRLLSLGPRIVTVTNGKEGAAVGASNSYLELPAFAVHAVDTTGAGDVFTGALIHAALEHWPPEEMLPFAMAAAALKCTGLGNRKALPDIATIKSLMDSRNEDFTPGRRGWNVETA